MKLGGEGLMCVKFWLSIYLDLSVLLNVHVMKVFELKKKIRISITYFSPNSIIKLISVCFCYSQINIFKRFQKTIQYQITFTKQPKSEVHDGWMSWNQWKCKCICILSKAKLRGHTSTCISTQPTFIYTSKDLYLYSFQLLPFPVNLSWVILGVLLLMPAFPSQHSEEVWLDSDVTGYCCCHHLDCHVHHNNH